MWQVLHNYYYKLHDSHLLKLFYVKKKSHPVRAALSKLKTYYNLKLYLGYFITVFDRSD